MFALMKIHSFSAQYIFHSPSCTKCNSSLQTIKQNKIVLLVKTKAKAFYYFVLDYFTIYFQCVIFFLEHQYSTFHGMPNRDNNGTAQWNSSEPGFHLKIDAAFYSCIISFHFVINVFLGMRLQKPTFIDLH